MFNLINIGERAGSGIPNIYSVWHTQGWQEPTITESFAPERITLTLPVNKKPLIKNVDKKISSKTQSQREAIIEYLTVNISAPNAALAQLLELKPTRVRELLKGLIEDGVIVSEGDKKNRIYKLKS